MNYRGAIVTDLRKLIAFFRTHCADTATLDQLARIIDDEEAWSSARDLFQDIRQKSLVATRKKRQTEAQQYLFEEICAKTIYNLSGEGASFDPDSPYWVVPHAVALGRRLGLADADVIAQISLQS